MQGLDQLLHLPDFFLLGGNELFEIVDFLLLLLNRFNDRSNDRGIVEFVGFHLVIRLRHHAGGAVTQGFLDLLRDEAITQERVSRFEVVGNRPQLLDEIKTEIGILDVFFQPDVRERV